ncbi:MAG: hypothetical protein ACLTYN_14275 [Dysosmobacter welbionis]
MTVTGSTTWILKALENYEFYYDRADADDYDIDLDTLRFETYDNIDSDTLDFDVRLYGDEGSFYATVRIDVEGGSAPAPATWS